MSPILSAVPATATGNHLSGEQKVVRKFLGLGRVGIVTLEYDKMIVVKRPQDPKDEFDNTHILREIACYEKLDAAPHRYVLSSLGGHDINSPAVHLPYMRNGDLADYLKRHGTEINPAQRMKWAFQLALAVHHLHALRVFHTDLRLPNILIDDELNLKVADFEGASFGGHGGTTGAPPQYTIKPYCLRDCLTVEELMQVDIYCLGSSIYEVQTGMKPHESFKEDEEFIKAYEAGNFPDTSQVTLGDLIVSIWRGEITDAKDVLLRIVTDVRFPDLLSSADGLH